MKWISKNDKIGCEIKLPDQICPGTWSQASVHSQAFEICWEPALRTLFVRTSAGSPEVPLKYRAITSQRFPGDLFREVLLEYVGGTDGFTRIVHDELAIQVPGLHGRHAGAGSASELVRSPMVGKVLKVLVETGQIVERGHELLVIEAMKMENKIFARSSGTIKDVQVAIGAQVSVGQPLVQISP